MIDVADGMSYQTAMDRGVYRPMNPRMVARGVFLGMFTRWLASAETS